VALIWQICHKVENLFSCAIQSASVISGFRARNRASSCRTDSPKLLAHGEISGWPEIMGAADDAGRKLDTRQFPELNAVFYTARPSEFINMRIMALSLLACDDAQLEPAFGTDRVIGSVTFSAAAYL
jgi:hypothetical protein